MKWVYILAGIALFVKILFMPDVVSNLSNFTNISITEKVVAESGVINAVSGIIFRNRLYDTIFEVIVFTIAILGCNFLLANENPSCTIYQFKDRSSIILARLGATITALVGCGCSWWNSNWFNSNYFILSMDAGYLPTLSCGYLGEDFSFGVYCFISDNFIGIRVTTWGVRNAF
jgi:multisubunit Na+/H+ antiporter MnhB subunit